MSDTQHSPGPWRLEGHPRQDYPDLIEYQVLAPNPDAGKECVPYSGAECKVCDLDFEPDAKLIAAAPEMADVLGVLWQSLCALRERGAEELAVGSCSGLAETAEAILRKAGRLS